MDLEPGWERKALIVLVVITFIIVIYAYNPFKGTPHVEIQNQTIDTSVAAPVPSTVVPDNSTANNTTINITSGNNGTFQISADQAKRTAAQAGYTVGEPTQGNLVINNSTISVWIVPLMKGTTVSKKIYVDASTGTIVGSEEVKS